MWGDVFLSLSILPLLRTANSNAHLRNPAARHDVEPQRLGLSRPEGGFLGVDDGLLPAFQNIRVAINDGLALGLRHLLGSRYQALILNGLAVVIVGVLAVSYTHLTLPTILLV